MSNPYQLTTGKPTSLPSISRPCPTSGASMPSRGVQGARTGHPPLCRPAPAQDRSRHPHRQRPGREFKATSKVSGAGLGSLAPGLQPLPHRSSRPGNVRPHAGRQREGYVDQFDDSVADLKQFHDEVIVPGQACQAVPAGPLHGGPSRPAIWNAGRTTSRRRCSPPHDGHQPRRPAKVAAKGLAATIGTVGGWVGEPPRPGSGTL